MLYVSMYVCMPVLARLCTSPLPLGLSMCSSIELSLNSRKLELVLMSTTDMTGMQIHMHKLV